MAPLRLVEELERAGRLAAAPVNVGSVGVCIAVRAGAPAPAIHDEASLREHLLAADAVVFNRASTGLYMERLLARMGLAAAVEPKAVRFPDGDGVLRRIAAGNGAEIAFAASALPPRPMQRPMASVRTESPSTVRRMPLRLEPSAIRRPSSRVRCVMSKATNP